MNYCPNKKPDKRCMPFTKEHKIKIGLALSGKNNSQWKGDKVGKIALHEWITKRLPKPTLCEICKIVPPMDLANKSGEYKRNLSDWEWLCRKCHMTKDGRLDKLIKNQNRNRGIKQSKEWKIKRGIYKNGGYKCKNPA